MIRRILANLERQTRALALLEKLLEEEFSLLVAHDASGVSSLEFSIHELLRQIAVERTDLRCNYAAVDPAAKRLTDLLDRFSPEEREAAAGLTTVLERQEKRCSELSARNYKMALGLYDTTKNCLDYLQSHLLPKKTVYGSRGRVEAAVPSPGRLDGRC